MIVKVEMPGKRLRSNPSLLAQALNSVGSRVAHTLASILGKRYSLRGRHMQDWRGYKAGHKRYISPRYPVRAGYEKIDKTRSFMFSNSAAFHRSMGVRSGSFNVNRGSGMWSGLSVVVSSVQRSRILFRGRSEGQGMQWRRGPDGGTPSGPYWRVNAKGVKVAKPKKVSNALKAATVFKMGRVNTLAPSTTEVSDLTRAVTAEAVGVIGHMFTDPIIGLTIPKSQITAIMRRAATMTKKAQIR